MRVNKTDSTLGFKQKFKIGSMELHSKQIHEFMSILAAQGKKNIEMVPPWNKTTDYFLITTDKETKTLDDKIARLDAIKGKNEERYHKAKIKVVNDFFKDAIEVTEEKFIFLKQILKSN